MSFVLQYTRHAAFVLLAQVRTCAAIPVLFNICCSVFNYLINDIGCINTELRKTIKPKKFGNAPSPGNIDFHFLRRMRQTKKLLFQSYYLPPMRFGQTRAQLGGYHKLGRKWPRKQRTAPRHRFGNTVLRLCRRRFQH